MRISRFATVAIIAICLLGSAFAVDPTCTTTTGATGSIIFTDATASSQTITCNNCASYVAPTSTKALTTKIVCSACAPGYTLSTVVADKEGTYGTDALTMKTTACLPNCVTTTGATGSITFSDGAKTSQTITCNNCAAYVAPTTAQASTPTIKCAACAATYTLSTTAADLDGTYTVGTNTLAMKSTACTAASGSGSGTGAVTTATCTTDAAAGKITFSDGEKTTQNVACEKCATYTIPTTAQSATTTIKCATCATGYTLSTTAADTEGAYTLADKKLVFKAAACVASSTAKYSMIAAIPAALLAMIATLF